MRRKQTVGTAVFTGVAAMGMALSSVGIAWAINPAPAPPAAPTAQVSQALSQDDIKAAVESQEAGDPTEATEAVESEDPANDVQEPSYATSLTAPQDEGLSEADEAIALESLATVTPDQARDAALAAVPGAVGKVELDNENGAVVYSVEITDSSGSDIDVKVDAGNGAVVYQDADGGDHEG